MCMINAQPWPEDRKKPKYGYKVFRCEKKALHGAYGMAYPPHKLGRWYRAKACPRNKSHLMYPPGFHTFFTEEDAKKWGLATFMRWPLVERYGDSELKCDKFLIKQVAVRGHQVIGHVVGAQAFTAEYMLVGNRESLWERFKRIFRGISLPKQED